MAWRSSAVAVAVLGAGAAWFAATNIGFSIEVGPESIFWTVLLVGLLFGASRRAYTVDREVAARLRELVFVDEALREANQELARSNAELEAFAYGASHDLKQPLRHVAMFLGLLQADHSEHLDDEARDYIERAVRGAERMSKLVDGMLRLSRAGCRVTTAEVALDEVMQEVEEDLARQLADNGGLLSWDALPVVQGDGLQLRQVLTNLVSNALKYHGDEPPEVRVSAARKERSWVVSVVDSGIGIPEEHREDVFQVYRRLQASASHEGAGIGLSLCKRIVEAHGGQIWVEPGVQHGAAVSFSLPAEG